jgi:hypothetical protein
MLVPGTWVQRAVRAAALSVPAVLLELVWLLRGEARGVHFHGPGLFDLRNVAAWSGGWFGTGAATSLRPLALVAAAAVVALAVWSAVGRGLPPPRRVMTVGLGLSAAFVGLTVLFTRAVLDALVTFNWRHMLPAQVAIVVLVGAVRINLCSWARTAAYAALCGLAVFAIWPWAARDAWNFGLGGSTSSTVHAVDHLFPAVVERPASRLAASYPKHTVVVSDFPENLWLQTGRGAIQLPAKRNINADTANDDYRSEMRDLAGVAGGGLLVMYACPGDGAVFPTVREITRYVKLTPVFARQGSCVFRVG